MGARARAACPRSAPPGAVGAFGLSTSTNLPVGENALPPCDHILKVWVGTEHIELQSRSPFKASRTRGNRRAITKFTKKSRSALRIVFNKLRDDHRKRCLFITLTYHENMVNGRQAKTDLHTFDKALTRAYGTNGYIWKMEPQKRGSIHFHLLVFGVKFIPYDWIADTWARIVARGGEIDEEQRKAGTSIQLAESGKAARHYLEKYIGKVLGDNDNPIDEPGRYWGARRMEQYQGERLDVPLRSRAGAVEVARTIDKLRRAQIVAAWRERGAWNRSVAVMLDQARAIIGSGGQLIGTLSQNLHKMCCKRSGGAEDPWGYEHTWMCHWARRRSKNVATQKTVWQVFISDRTAAQLLTIALAS